MKYKSPLISWCSRNYFFIHPFLFRFSLVTQSCLTLWTIACQASLSINNSWSLLKLMSSESMPSNSVIFNITYITMYYETSLGDWNKNIYINYYFIFFHCYKYLWTFVSLWKIPLNSSWKYFLNECIIICHIKCYFWIHWCFYSLLLFSC